MSIIIAAFFRLLYAYLAIINIVAFAAYGIDKNKAKHKKWRVKEHTLLKLAWIGGALGALVGMYVFKHKTKHAKFKYQVPVALAIWIVILYFVLPWLRLL